MVRVVGWVGGRELYRYGWGMDHTKLNKMSIKL